MKYYAVRKGRKIAIFETWTECQEATKGYPGVQFKSFSDLEQAKTYLEEGKEEKEDKKVSNKGRTLTAYVDGSFSKKNNLYGSGCVLLEDGEIISQSCFPGYNPEYLPMNNVAGEIQAAKAAVKFAINHNYDAVDIYYDYTGIKEWAIGNWETNRTATGNYKKYMMEASRQININFHKVEAHTGDKYNEMADKLAKKAVGIL